MWAKRAKRRTTSKLIKLAITISQVMNDTERFLITKRFFNPTECQKRARCQSLWSQQVVVAQHRMWEEGCDEQAVASRLDV